MAVQSAESKANVAGFLRAASQLQSNGVFFNKDFLKSFNLMDKCFEISKSYLGKDYNFLHDATGVRLYIRDVFGQKSLNYFENADGEIVLDLEHALLFYYKVLSMNSSANLINAALGIVYFVAGHQLDEEMIASDRWTSISKVAPKSRITPAFELHAQFFRWKRCNFVLRKYMLQLSVPQGYKAYYYEDPAFGQIAYLIHRGHTYHEAVQITGNSKGGLFFSWLPIHIENYLIPSIMTGGFDPSLMDGYYAQSYIRDNQHISQSYTVDEMYNVYNMMVKPTMVELMGMVINSVHSDMARNSHFNLNDMSIYHVSPQRIGILIKENMNIEHVLPTSHQLFKPVSAFDLGGVLNGDFI